MTEGRADGRKRVAKLEAGSLSLTRQTEQGPTYAAIRSPRPRRA